jgi:hypothetical protein
MESLTVVRRTGHDAIFRGKNMISSEKSHFSSKIRVAGWKSSGGVVNNIYGFVLLLHLPAALSSQLFSNHNKQLLKNPETAGELIIIKNETTVRRRAGARGPIWE